MQGRVGKAGGLGGPDEVLPAGSQPAAELKSGEGRLALLWPLDSPTGDPADAVIPPELHDALVRFAGERWRPPAGT